MAYITHVRSRNFFKDQGCIETTLSRSSASTNSTEKHCVFIRKESIEHLLPPNFIIGKRGLIQGK